MSSGNIPIGGSERDITAPTPQNTPLNTAPISGGGALSRPTVPDIQEGDETGAAAEELASALSGMGAGGGGRGMHEAVLGMVQGRLGSLVGRDSGYLDSLPIPAKQRVQALKGVHVEQTELQNAYKRECLELEKKYLNLTKPLYERRRQLINGDGDPPKADEITKGEEQSKKDDEEYKSLPSEVSEEEKAKAKAGEGIPEFWLTALRNHLGITELITDRDAGALKHLKDITLSYLDGEEKPGFKLTFHFGGNEFFENDVLEKTYLYQSTVGYSGDFVYDRALGTEIKWKSDEVNLTKEFEIKKQRNKNTNRTRLVRKAKPSESFFNFFDPPVPPSPKEDKDEEEDDEDLDELEEKLEMDYQIGEDLKEKIVPKAVDYFTGKALEYDLMEAGDDSDWSGADDDDDEDEDDEDDDEDAFEDEEDSDEDR